MQEPAITQKDPIAYYRWLRAQRMPGAQATQLVEQRFGPPTTPDERAQRQQAQAENAGLAQAGGVVAGGIVANEALRGFPNVRNWTSTTEQPFGSGMGNQVGGAITNAQGIPAQTGFTSTANMTGNGLYTPYKPEVVATNGDVSIIKTPAGGTTQIPSEALNDPGFMSSVNWDAVGSGALALLSAYQAYKSYQSGDNLGAGISGATAASLGAQAANQAGMQFAGSQTLGAAAAPLAVAAGVYQGYKTAEMIGETAAGSQRTQQGALGGAASGAMIGSYFGPWGLAIGAAVGAAAGAIGSWTGSSKGKAQFMRDNIRNVLKENKVLDQNYMGTLADGTKYNFGQDGSTLKWKNIDKIAEAQPNAWNNTIPLAGALAAAYGFVGQKNADIAAWYAKGAVSNAGDDPAIAVKNMQHFAQQQGVTYDLVKQKLDEALKDERIDQTKYNEMLSGAQQLTAGVQPTQQNSMKPPPKGEVRRVSPGMYMNDQGVVTKAKTVRQALESNYRVSKSKKEK
jgi:hypothetical protein